MNPNKESSNFSLEQARIRVTEVTSEIVDLFCERQSIMSDIANAKNRNGEAHLPIFLPQREQELLRRFRNVAKEKGVDPNMTDMLVSMLMSAAKFAQRDILQRTTILDTERPNIDLLKSSLLDLTRKVARPYDEYDGSFEGTHIECVREQEILTELAQLSKGECAVNLGCANGSYVSRILSGQFKRIVGYDISPDMIACAKEKYPEHEFYIHDLDNGIPLSDESVDLVVANFGSASEVCVNLWEETARVLKPAGRAFFSFYNQKALITRWWTPWSNSYRITINIHNDTIMVPVAETDDSAYVYWIYGRAVDDKDVYTSARASGLQLRQVESSSPLWDDKPREFFKHQDAVKSAIEYEKGHAHIAPYLGQYLRVVVNK